MFPLTHKIKEEIRYNGVTYPLNLAFNNVLSVFDVLEDEELTPNQSLETVLYLLLGEENLAISMQDKVDLLKKIFTDYIGQQTSFVTRDLKGNPIPATKKAKEAPVYSFRHDADYIYAAFMQAYRIDLIDEQNKMSWSHFKALFAGLPEGTAFRNIVNIRMKELPKGKGTEKEREELKKLKKIYRLPDEEGDG